MAKNTRELIIRALITLAKKNPQRSSFTMTEIAAEAGIYDKRFIKSILTTLKILSNTFTKRPISTFLTSLISSALAMMEILSAF